MHFWLVVTGLFGLNPVEFVVRFPSTVCATLCAVVVFALGKRFINAFACFIASILYILCFLQLVYAQQTRAYATQALFVCLIWLALLVALQKEKTHLRWCFVYISMNVLAVYAQLFSLLIFIYSSDCRSSWHPPSAQYMANISASTHQRTGHKPAQC